MPENNVVKVEVSLKDIQERLLAELLQQPRTYTDDDGHEYTSDAPLVEAISQRVVVEVQKQFAEQIKAVVETTIKAEVERQLAEGFSTFGEFGRKSEPKTLNQLIQESLSKTSRDGYNGPELTMVERVIHKAVDEALLNFFKEEVKAIKESFSGTVKAKLGEAAAEAIARAAGIR